MTREFRLLALVGLFAAVGLARPSEVAAQRRPPARGGAHVAVPRTHSPASYRPYHYRPSYRPYYYRPYYYSRYYYAPYAYRPYYYSPWYLGIGFGFNWSGSYWGAYGPSYAYPYPYAYPNAYPYGYPSPSSGYDYMGSTPPPSRYDTYEAPPTNRANDRGAFGTLSLRVMPSDAAILIDGEAWDRPQAESRFSIDLAEGPHRVEVRKQGYGSYVRTLEVPRGRTITLNVGLTPGGSSEVARTVPLTHQR